MDSGAEIIYSMYETLCTVADMGVAGHRVYVCARVGMHVRYISTI